MVLQILQDIYAFLIVMLICLVGFTMAFVTMLPDQPRFQLPMALLSSFETMLGAWDLEQFGGCQFDGDASGWGNPALTTLSVLAFVLYAVFVLVTAMNLLITVMGDSYDRVREEQAVHGRIQRAETLVAMDWLVLRLCRVRRCWSEEECCPMFLHVLVAADDDGDAKGRGEGDEWGGRLKQRTKAILNEVEQRLRLSEQRLKSEIEAAKAEMAAVKVEMATKAEMAAVKAEMAAVKAEMAAVKADVAAVKADVAAVKAEMVTKAEFNEGTFAAAVGVAGWAGHCATPHGGKRCASAGRSIRHHCRLMGVRASIICTCYCIS